MLDASITNGLITGLAHSVNLFTENWDNIAQLAYGRAKTGFVPCLSLLPIY